MRIRHFAPTLLLLASAALAQTPCVTSEATEALEAALIAEGFESVGACVEGAETLVTYENRRYRDDVRALEVVARLATMHTGGARLRLVPTEAGIPIVRVDTDAGSPDAESPLGAATTTATLTVPARPETTHGPWLTLDAVLHPVVRAEFGDFDRPVRADIELHPTLDVVLWPGASATAQLVVPVVSDVQGSDGSVRPGILALHQRLRTGTTFARVSAGRFTRDRYGFDASATTYVADGRIALSGRAGFTGYADLVGSRLLYSALNTATYMAGIEAVVSPRYALTASVEVERFLSGATGVRGEIARQFGETRVGFFGLVADGDPNVGGRIAFALPIAKHARPGRLRARLADRMEIEYRYRRLGEGTPGYEVVPVPDAPLGQLHPRLLDARLERRPR